jgi:hypothetical protein
MAPFKAPTDTMRISMTPKKPVFKYIETFNNLERLHQTLEYQSPDQFERKQKIPSVA